MTHGSYNYTYSQRPKDALANWSTLYLWLRSINEKQTASIGRMCLYVITCNISTVSNFNGIEQFTRSRGLPSTTALSLGNAHNTLENMQRGNSLFLLQRMHIARTCSHSVAR